MSAEFEVPANHYTLDVVLHFDAASGSTNVVIPLQRRLEHVDKVFVTELCVVSPNGNLVTPSLWRLSLSTLLRENAITNATGDGWLFNIDNNAGTTAGIVCTHQVLSPPRLLTSNTRGVLSDLLCNITAVGSAAAPVPATFTSATFYLTFFCRDPGFAGSKPEDVLRKDLLLPQNAQGQFSTRAPFF